MAHNIHRDWKYFRDIIDGNVQRALRKHFDSGRFTIDRGKNGKLSISVPKINRPYITYGQGDTGLNRGPGEKGDVIGRDPSDDSQGAGNEEGEGIWVNIDLEYVLQFMQDELKLPDLKPKESDTYEDMKTIYNSISSTGSEALRHNKKTWLRALKRCMASGELGHGTKIPGFVKPINLISVTNQDKRYKQYNEIHIPSNNAVIMFGRDGSASMDQEKCDIVSDMSWWIDVWIRRFYDKVERVYFWHDTVAQEVDEGKFYKYRYGGGTNCSSCLKLMAKQFENRFPPEKWNIYCFYFTDGDNWNDDNQEFIKSLYKDFSPDIVNLFAITQVLTWNYNDSIKKYVDETLTAENNNVRTVSIGPEMVPDYSSSTPWNSNSNSLSDEERYASVKRAIQILLGDPDKVPTDVFAGESI